MRKRGVSPIVAAVLLTAIVVTLGVGVFMWAVGAFTTLGQSIDIFYKLRGEQRLEYLIVEHVRAVNQSALSVFVRNTGSIDIELSAIYVINLKNASQFHRLELGRRQCWIPVGGYVSITVTLPWTLVAGNAYQVKVSTYRGTVAYAVFTV